MDEATVNQYIRCQIAGMLGMAEAEIQDSDNLLGLGISSLQAVRLINSLRAYIGSLKGVADVEINPAVIFECQSILDLSRYVMKQLQ